MRNKKSLEDQILEIQHGDTALRNEILEEYHPFIKSVLAKVLNEYIESENEYFSIGLLAFNEAIDRYDQKKGKFLTFAAMVMKSRTIDELRRKKKLAERQIGGDEELQIVESPNFEKRLEDQMEIETFKNRIEAFGFDLETLIDTAPKHEKTRIKAIEIARVLYEDKELRETFLKTGKLPGQGLEKKAGATRRILQRSRNFIIAVFFILDSDLEVLKKYVDL